MWFQYWLRYRPKVLANFDLGFDIEPKPNSSFGGIVMLTCQNGPSTSLNQLSKTGVNTSYLTDSYNMFTLKMESVSKNTIFGLKMMVKSGLEKFILRSLHAGR